MTGKKPRYSMLSFPQYSPVRPALRDSRPLRPDGKPSAGKMYPGRWTIRIASTEAEHTCIHGTRWDAETNAFAKPLSLVLEGSQQSAQVPEEWKTANVTLVFKTGRKEDLGNYRQVRPISVPGQVMEQLILETIYRHMKVKKEIRSRQHGEAVFIAAANEPLCKADVGRFINDKPIW